MLSIVCPLIKFPNEMFKVITKKKWHSSYVAKAAINKQANVTSFWGIINKIDHIWWTNWVIPFEGMIQIGGKKEHKNYSEPKIHATSPTTTTTTAATVFISTVIGTPGG